jgi:DNA-directed RNA polymerase subunit RPC12/RpoP
MFHVIVSVQNLTNEEVKMQAYCVKCKKKVEIKNPKAITMKNKRPATQGVCPSCGTKVFRIGK